MVVLPAALLAVLVAALFGCTQDSEEVDAEVVVAESVAAMQELETFHFAYEVEKPAGSDPAEGLEIIALEGDVTVNGEMEATVDVQQSGIPLQISFIAVGGTHYLQFPGAPTWQQVSEGESPLGPLNLSAGTIRILERLQDLAFEGQEEVDGVTAYRLSGLAPAEDVEAIAQAVDRTDPFAAEVWIAVEDHLVHRIRLEGAATEGEPEGTIRHISLTDFDTPVQIEPPS
ncbi:MAG: hypothetical protein Kow00129_13560 [Thermoleophilia bacterium]